MNWTLAGLLLLAAAAVAALSVGIGYAWSSSNAASKIATANGDTKTCMDANAAAVTALTTVTASLRDLKARHDAMKQDAERALDLRDSEIADLSHELEQRQGNMRKAGKYDPQCLSLVDLPVCPAVARELWPHALEQAPERGQPAGHD